ncbi:MAG: AAA family ATPase, partial [Acidimicrobiia bacterium]
MARSRWDDLVGRRKERELLRAALDDVANGSGRVIVVTGDAGIGKSSLVDAVLADASDRGWPTFMGRCREIERELPFGALADLAGSALKTLADALRPAAALTMADRAIVVFDALLEALEGATVPDGPVAVAFEDVHWADPGTVDVLRRLARSAPLGPLLLMVTRRTGPLRRPLELALDTMETATTLHLDGLADEAVEELVRRRFAAPPTPRLGEGLAGCAGNPFYVETMLDALADDGQLHTETGELDLHDGAPAVPHSARDVLRRHVSFLPDDARRLLQLASLLGSDFSARQLAAVANRPATELLERLDGALTSGRVVDA